MNSKARDASLVETLSPQARGLQCLNAGDAEQACALFRQALALEPDQVGVLVNLGAALLRRGQAAEALAPLERALALDPRSHAGHFNFGLTLESMGRRPLALHHFHMAVWLSPAFALYVNQLGRVLRAEHPQDALVLLQRAVELDAGNIGFGLDLVRALIDLTRWREADAVLAPLPADERVLNARGVVAMRMGDMDRAQACFSESLEKNPNSRDTLVNFAKLAHMGLGQHERAAQFYRQVLARTPDDAEMLTNLGAVLVALYRFDEADALYERAHAIDAGCAAHFNLALSRLQQGDFARGWALYDARMRLPNFMWREFIGRHPLWDGQALPAGKKLALCCEQGLGDSVQLLRYLPLVRAAVGEGRLCLIVQPEIVPMLAGWEGVEVFVLGAPWSGADVWLPMFSLPRIFATQADSIPSPEGYLTLDSQGQVRLGAPAGPRPRYAGRPRVGLVWRGSRRHENNLHRSLAFAAFAAFADCEVEWVCLQHDGMDEAIGAGWLAAPTIGNFLDLARVIDSLDLVIGVDTAVIHLAAAMGVPTWVLTARPCDWRWGVSGEASGWYRALRVFRQPDCGDWPAVLGEVGQALASWCEAAQENMAPRPAQRWGAERPEVMGNRGLALKNLGRLDEAETLLRRAIGLMPQLPELHSLLGSTLLAKGDHAAAEQSYREATRLRPGSADFHCNLGLALKELCRFEESERVLQEALRLNPGISEVWLNQGNLYMDWGRLPQAEAALEQAVAMQRDAVSRFDLGLCRLMQGKLAQAWPDYEARLQLQTLKVDPATLPFPPWRGEPLAGKKLLVIGEQGFGDHIQFIRHVAPLAQAGATVDVLATAGLETLLATARGVHWVAPQVTIEGPDFWVFMASLPGMLGVDLGSVPAEVPYLFADTARVDFWRERVAARAPHGLRVGLCAAGNRAHRNDRFRSLRVDDVAPLARVPGVTFFSLQKDGAGSLPQEWGVCDLGGELGDFRDTAALLGALDLVISVDTAVVHLAGALNVPVWTLLPANPDWRWMRERDDCPWYPSMRLFRQQELGDWSPVIDQVIDALATIKT